MFAQSLNDPNVPLCEVWQPGESHWTCLRGDGAGLELLAMTQAVPAELIDLIGAMRYPTHFRAEVMRVQDSAVAVFRLHAEDHHVLTVVDVAGRSDHAKRAQADAEYRLYALLHSCERPGAMPIVQIRGMRDVLEEVSGLRPLSSEELADVVLQLRRDLQLPGGLLQFGIAGDFECKSLTLTVCT